MGCRRIFKKFPSHIQVGRLNSLWHQVIETGNLMLDTSDPILKNE